VLGWLGSVDLCCLTESDSDFVLDFRVPLLSVCRYDMILDASSHDVIDYDQALQR